METNFNNKSPIFIVGMPRSGTTLISSLLSAHPNITIPYSETKFLCNWVKDNSSTQDRNCPKDFTSFWQEYSSSDRFSYLDIDANAVLERILTTGKHDYKTIFTSVLQEYAIKMNKPRWGEKTPNHFQYLDLLFEWYPQARIIWMLRDPRAVTASLIAVPWAVDDAVTHAYSWRNSIRDLEKWSDDERVQMVKYEELVTKPESTLQKVCKFIDEEYTPTIFNRSKTNSPIINRTGWYLEHLENALKPITNTSIEKWRSNLSETQIAIVEHVTKNKMLQYGYQVVTSGPKPVSLVEFYLKRAGRRIQLLKTSFLTLAN